MVYKRRFPKGSPITRKEFHRTRIYFRYPVSNFLINIIAGINHKIPRHPLMVQVKIKDHSHRPCACSRFVSLIQPFPFYSLIHLVHLTSFSTPGVSVSYLNTHTFPQPQFDHFRLFLPANCLQKKKQSPITSALFCLY